MSTRRARKSGDRAEIDMAPGIGMTIQRLRKAYKMSLGDLSEQSGVAKPIRPSPRCGGCRGPSM
jgi:XRE family transcriptional regulator, regulator of sulfur utilization